MTIDSYTKKISNSKQFIGGLGISLALLAVTLPMVIPMISINAEGVQTNAIDVAEIKSDMTHLDKSLIKLDASIAKLDDRLMELHSLHDKLNLILCDMSSGDHC